MQVIVSVATGYRYLTLQNRLITSVPGEAFLTWRDAFPPGSPFHTQVPYAFKAYALQEAYRQGFDTILWADASIVARQSLKPLWNEIESKGYWFSENPPWNCGQWTRDGALSQLGITREEAFEIPQIIGGAFGLHMQSGVAREFLRRYLYYAKNTSTFLGPWKNNNGEASEDKRVLGHRHDQTVASVIAHKLGMELTKPPLWITDKHGVTTDTVLEIRRAGRFGWLMLRRSG